MDFMELANQRQATRAFTEQMVSHEMLMECVRAAQLAPSACNSQPWKFVVVETPELVKQVADAIIDNPAGINKNVEHAPVLVAVVEEQATLIPQARGLYESNHFAQFDLGSATQYFCLRAAELGLGTCILGAFNEEKVKQLLQIPAERRVFVMLAGGHPSGKIRPKIRKHIEEIHSFDQYHA